MLTVYSVTSGVLIPSIWAPGDVLPETTIWLDLLRPTPEEDKAVEACIGAPVPTEADMNEIEVSSRLYIEDGVRYMTASILAGAQQGRPGLVNVGFVLARGRLVTVRHGEPRVLKLFSNRICKMARSPETGEALLVGLLEAVIDRTADILERVGAEVDEISRRIFARQHAPARQKKDYMALLHDIGRRGDLLSMTRESLVSISRMVGFLSAKFEGMNFGKDMRSQLGVMMTDAAGLRDHTSYLGDKIVFLLDATVGMVSIEQNDIMKLFSIVSVILMPPTLIASIYGMNFDLMPELHFRFGYPMALMAMAASAVVPYLIFRMKHWL
ncbi:magnesium transporter CorA family protein [Terrihabitans sp. B22-R8]|uniref:magnesium transporter CorA family protein n=1 Tax=Terrihabitans sp. B22-R8 TaxID=3425128 RepID=UPI00403D4740